MNEPECPPEFKVDFFDELKVDHLNKTRYRGRNHQTNPHVEQCRYEKTDPEKFTAFVKILNDCGNKFVSENPTGDPNVTEQMNGDMRSRISTLFADEPDLIVRFDEAVKQQKMKASEKYGFGEHVQLRFADEPDKLAEFNSLILNVGKKMLEDPSPQRPPLVWKEMHSRMLTVLDGETDLVEEFEVYYAQVQALGIQA